MHEITFRVKQQLVCNNINYLLLEMYSNKLLPEKSVTNIIAVDKQGDLVWVVERPKTKFDIYSRMRLEESNLIAYTSGGHYHQIDQNTGKILSDKMIK